MPPEHGVVSSNLTGRATLSSANPRDLRALSYHLRQSVQVLGAPLSQRIYFLECQWECAQGRSESGETAKFYRMNGVVPL
jgi:hypothetical protein